MAALALGGVLFATRLWDHKLLLGDEGVATLGAWRILEGQVPGRDFFEIIPPFSFLPTALAFKLFGLTVVAERAVALLLAILLPLLSDLLLRRLRAGIALRAFSLALLIPFGVLYWPMPSHHWWADALQVGAALALLRVPASRRPALPGFSAGLLCGLALFSLQDQGLLFIAGLLALYWAPCRHEPWARPALAGWAAGLGSVTAAFALWLLPAGALQGCIEGWVLFPFTGYGKLPGHRFDLLAGFKEVAGLWTSGAWGGAPFYVFLLTGCCLVLLLLPVAAPFALLVGRKRDALPAPARGLLAALALAFIVTALRRWSLTNAVWAAPGLIPAFATLYGTPEASRLRRWAGPLFGTLALLFAAYGASFYLRARNAVEITTPAGTLRSMAFGDARALHQALEALEREVPPGEPVFCLGFHSMVNFLSGHPNPTRYNVFLRPSYSLPLHGEEVAGDLASGRVPWVLAGAGSIPPPEDPSGKALRDHYDLRFRNGRYLLLKFRPGEPEVGP